MTSEEPIWIGRDGQKYGPYAEATVRQWLQEGKLTPATLGWRHGMAEWLPLSAFIVEAPRFDTPPPPPPPFDSGLRGNGYGYGSAPLQDDPRADFPRPPSMHWLLVLLLSLVTFGIFAWVWYFVQASWVKKIDRSSSAMTLFIVALVAVIVGGVFSAHSPGVLGGLLTIASSVLTLCAFFSMKQSMREDAIRRGIPLEIGGITLFFFNLLYMQGQFTWLARWKDTGQTTPPAPKGVFWWLLALPFILAIALAIAIPQYQHSIGH